MFKRWGCSYNCAPFLGGNSHRIPTVNLSFAGLFFGFKLPRIPLFNIARALQYSRLNC